MRAIVGHLARAGVIQPSPSPPDRVAGPRRSATWDGARARGLPHRPRRRARSARWRQYRSVWAWVEGSSCRREGILRHFGDRREPAAAGPVLRRLRSRRSRPRRRRPRARAPRPAGAARAAARRGRPRGARRGDPRRRRRAPSPAVGRTRAVEILRGGRSKVIAKYSYDGLPQLRRVRRTCAPTRCSRASTRCCSAGTLRSTGGRFPKLEVA